MQYPVTFQHDANLADCVTEAVYVPEAEKSGVGVKLKPRDVSRTVRRFTGTLLNVWFNRSCPTSTGIGSCGMLFADEAE